jgi:DNA polymerase III alpha subunit
VAIAVLIAKWREAGSWWQGEPTHEYTRNRDALGVRRETVTQLDRVFKPQQTTLPISASLDHREDWSLRARKVRDEKASIAVHGKPLPLILSKGFAEVKYAPLHVLSGYSFGRGVMLTEEMVQFASNAGLPALALTDSFSLAGALELAKYAAMAGIKPIIGSSFTLETGGEIVLLAANATGYQNLSKIISDCHLLEPRQFPLLRFEYLRNTEGILCLTGGSVGPLVPILARRDYRGAKALLEKLTHRFGHTNVYLEVERSYLPFEHRHNELLIELASETGLIPVAAGMVTHARPEHFPVQDVITCAHHLCQIDEVWGRKPYRHESQPVRFHLPERGLNAERYLRTASEMAERYTDAPYLLENTLRVAERIESDVTPNRTVLPNLYDHPEQMLRDITWSGAFEKYHHIPAKLRKRIEHELERIQRLGYAGHFLCLILSELLQGRCVSA